MLKLGVNQSVWPTNLGAEGPLGFTLLFQYMLSSSSFYIVNTVKKGRESLK